jgi:hypothetical protein
MKNLKQAIEELVIDQEIIARIAEYETLLNKLNNDEQRKQISFAVVVSFDTCSKVFVLLTPMLEISFTLSLTF